MITELSERVPKWLMLKTLPGKGKIVKVFNQVVNSMQVNQAIKDGLGSD
jgi:hypothetical protein